MRLARGSQPILGCCLHLIAEPLGEGFQPGLGDRANLVPRFFEPPKSLLPLRVVLKEGLLLLPDSFLGGLGRLLLAITYWLYPSGRADESPEHPYARCLL